MEGKFSTSGLFTVNFEEICATASAVSSEQLLTSLKDELKSYHSRNYVVLFNTGFWALVSAIKMKLTNPDTRKVIMPSLTYRRLADAVYWAGGEPVFLEVDEVDLALSLSSIEAYMNNSGEAALILLVQPIVGSVDVNRYRAVSIKHEIPLIVDSVESVHDSVNGVRCGSFDVPEVFSFHASKFINGFEGGYVTTNCKDEAAQLAKMAENFQSAAIGLSPFHAAVALANIRSIGVFQEHNKKVFDSYKIEFRKHGLERFGEILSFHHESDCGFKNVVCKLKHESNYAHELVSCLNKSHIFARLHYQPPLHAKEYSYTVSQYGDLEYSGRVGECLVNLPCGWRFQPEDVGLVCTRMAEFFDERV